MVSLRLTRQIAVEANVRKEVVPEPDDKPRRPDIRPHVHPDAEQADPVVYRDAQFPFDEPFHLFLVQGRILGIQPMGLYTDHTACRIDKLHRNPSLQGLV